jgi:C4-dicarboxylate-specific signal transduction histidine kinase
VGVGLLTQAAIIAATVFDDPGQPLALLAVLLVQALLVGALVIASVQRGRLNRELSRLSEAASARAAEYEEQRRELAHLGRVAALGELSGTIAHELQQPLAAIITNVKAAQRVLASPQAKLPDVAPLLSDVLSDIADDTLRASGVIHNAGALVRKGTAPPTPVCLNDVVAKSLDLMRGELRRRGVAVTRALAPSLPSVVGDDIQLQQVVLNLFMNACDALMGVSVGKRRIVVSTTMSDGEVRLSVSDNGCGIPDGDTERLFQPFFTSKQHGLGLGLSICRSIVASHSGRLWAVNNVNGGATFHMATPVCPGMTIVHAFDGRLREPAVVS